MSKKRSILGILLLTVLLLVSGCTKSKPQLTEDNEKDLANMITYLEDQNYESSVEEADSDIFPGIRMRIKTGTEILDVYFYENPTTLEEVASGIGKDGSSYQNKSKTKVIEISWISEPHFFKKNTMMVQYIGEDKNIIKLLTTYLGPQFAGM
ncbi:hypothetical protein [Proteiniclasticum ruminis]|uniref:Lipoprotein n=1 Tax=Proteiniclasticum ruminis TaxID=398199 RepID=A0A1I5E394_9CLOT|nr:hypothetical protein [Proteiniclasticum ruminis]SFO05803.1 hypothetical protein SAMN04488695_11318 [Proteiniclasticum ruminis]